MELFNFLGILALIFGLSFVFAEILYAISIWYMKRKHERMVNGEFQRRFLKKSKK